MPRHARKQPIEDDGYFLSVLRYIHQNPVKAGLVKKPGEYPYSSYNCYIDFKGDQLVDIDFLLDIMSRKQLEEFNSEASEEIYMDMTEGSFRLTDGQAKDIIRKVSKCKNVSAFQSLENKEKSTYIQKLKKEGLSIRQISRLTGVSKGIVERGQEQAAEPSPVTNFDSRLHYGEVAYQSFFPKEDQDSFPKCLLRFYTMSEVINSVISSGFRLKEFLEHPSFEDSKLPGFFTIIAYK